MGESFAFKQAVKDAGVSPIRLHDCRHTSTTLLLTAGVSAKVVQERVGHHSAAFTLDDYAHAIPAEQAEVAARLASLVGTWLLQISLQIHRA